jgi:NADH dehydrogenase (ubiquinone) Fe-S protein 4
MSLFRAGSSACFRASRIAVPINARFISSQNRAGDPGVKTSSADAPSTPPTDSSLIRKETPSEAMARHQPDYEATIDHATS